MKYCTITRKWGVLWDLILKWKLSRDTINLCCLRELIGKGDCFTWFNRRQNEDLIGECLVWFFCNFDWQMLFPKVSITSMEFFTGRIIGQFIYLRILSVMFSLEREQNVLPLSISGCWRMISLRLLSNGKCVDFMLTFLISYYSLAEFLNLGQDLDSHNCLKKFRFWVQNYKVFFIPASSKITLPELIF